MTHMFFFGASALLLISGVIVSIRGIKDTNLRKVHLGFLFILLSAVIFGFTAHHLYA